MSLPVDRFRIPPREVEEMLPQQALFLDVAGRALDRAGLTDEERPRTGVYLGVGLDLNTTNFHLRWAALRDDPDLADAAGPPLTANRTMGALASIAASRAARAYRLGGPSFTVSSGESSGLTALRLAAEAIANGEIDAALVGAVDLAGDVRAVLAGDGRPACDAAVALVLRRGGAGLGDVDRSLSLRLGGREVYAGAVTGLAGLYCSRLGSLRPPRREGFFAVEGATPAELLGRLDELRRWAEGRAADHIDPLTRDWLSTRWRPAWRGLAVALVPRDRGELLRLIDQAAAHLQARPGEPSRDRVLYSPRPLGASPVAFVYPGSGNDFPGMGRDLAQVWPELSPREEVLPRFWAAPPGEPTVRDRLFAQVALGTLVTDLLAGPLGLRPAAAVGYSLGESSMLFGLGAWRDRGEMLARMNASTLFTSDLTGRRDAARAAWGLPAGEAIDWRTAVVERPPGEVRAALAGLDQAYLQIVNTPRECVVGGRRDQVEELARRLGCGLIPVPETTTMHCPVVRPVAEAYRALHLLPTTTPDGVRFYSAGLGRAYEVDAESAADAILAQALDTIDFPAVIEAAYRDGVRVFVEAGPGSSCSRMIAAILGDRPHLARSACVPGDGLAAVWRLAAQLVAERVPFAVEGLYGEPAPRGDERRVSLPVGAAGFRVPAPSRGAAGLVPAVVPRPAGINPAAQLGRAAAVNAARAEAQSAFLRLDASLQRTFADAVAFQGHLFDLILQGATPSEEARPVALDRQQCLEYAIGKIANVLGPDFAEADSFPTRVRLPDEPLMLVDRILTIEGEPRSLTHGRVVTEHDVLPGAWYLDNGRIPTCLAVESGQADLFLSGYLGIDLRTRGLAVYRLLDAVVTFHRGLPTAGETIRYDIHIDRFFRQGETHLFRFRFVGTVNGEPLLTMTDGCAGFFSAEELAAGKGVVQTPLQLRPRPGVEPDDAAILPPVVVESYTEAQVDALRRGDLAGCFGPLFAGLPPGGAWLPGGRMRLVHRVTRLEPRGGRFGIGRITAEADIRPDDWFLTCHFVDDQVMPGTLMYECCLHTLRIFLLRLGWVGEAVCEPVPGVGSRLKCRGQVTAATRTVTYEVVLKERGYRPEPYVICDALMYADGKAIVEITDMTLRMSGLTREKVAAVWSSVLPSPPLRGRGAGGEGGLREPEASATVTRIAPSPLTPLPRSGGEGDRTALFDRHHILAFATGKPSEAFGDRYLPFDTKFIARLPAPPYSFLDRVVKLDAQPWKMVAGGTVEAEYDVPPGEWYFAAERAAVMPFAVLLEIPLQVCGWMSAYLGSALTSEQPLHYRNLGGSAELTRVVTPDAGTLISAIRCTRVAASGGMIIQDFDLEVRDRHGVFYRGATTFGFFSAQALAQQVGIRDAKPYAPTEAGRSFDYPRGAPFPDDTLRMIDRVELLADGGPAGLGFVEGVKAVQPDEWFFQAHFYQDPVTPGSLGLEAMLQLLKVIAVDRWGPARRFEANVGKHRWRYRGQVVPTNRQVRVQAVVTARDDAARRLVADGYLSVDGLVIYQMSDFSLRLADGPGLG